MQPGRFAFPPLDSFLQFLQCFVADVVDDEMSASDQQSFNQHGRPSSGKKNRRITDVGDRIQEFKRLRSVALIPAELRIDSGAENRVPVLSWLVQTVLGWRASRRCNVERLPITSHSERMQYTCLPYLLDPPPTKPARTGLGSL